MVVMDYIRDRQIFSDICKGRLRQVALETLIPPVMQTADPTPETVTGIGVKYKNITLSMLAQLGAMTILVDSYRECNTVTPFLTSVCLGDIGGVCLEF